MIKLRTREKDEISDPKSDKAWRETITFIDTQVLESEVSWFGGNQNGERRCQLHGFYIMSRNGHKNTVIITDIYCKF